MEEQLAYTLKHAFTKNPSIQFFPKTTPKVASLTALKKQGFSVKAGYTGSWTEEEIQTVDKFLKTYLEDPESLNYHDTFLYVSRKILHGSKSRHEVKKYLTNMLKKDKLK